MSNEKGLAKQLALKRLVKTLAYSIGATVVTTLASNVDVVNNLIPEKYSVIAIPIITSLLMSAEKYFKVKKS